MRFSVKNTDIFPMPGASDYIHMASVSYGLREFVAFVCVRGQRQGSCYIEEVVLVSNSTTEDVVANLKFIDDDNLAFDLSKFLEDRKLLDIKERMGELLDRGKMHWIT